MKKVIDAGKLIKRIKASDYCNYCDMACDDCEQECDVATIESAIVSLIEQSAEVLTGNK